MAVKKHLPSCSHDTTPRESTLRVEYCSSQIVLGFSPGRCITLTKRLGFLLKKFSRMSTLFRRLKHPETVCAHGSIPSELPKYPDPPPNTEFPCWRSFEAHTNCRHFLHVRQTCTLNSGSAMDGQGRLILERLKREV